LPRLPTTLRINNWATFFSCRITVSADNAFFLLQILHDVIYEETTLIFACLPTFFQQFTKCWNFFSLSIGSEAKGLLFNDVQALNSFQPELCRSRIPCKVTAQISQGKCNDKRVQQTADQKNSPL